MFVGEKNEKITLLVAAITIPIFVALMMEMNLFWQIEVHNDWIGFYASYLGSIIGVYGVFKVMRIDQRERNEEKNDELFLKNILLYKKISSLLRIHTLNDFGKKIKEIKNEENWDMVDTATKHKITQFETQLYYCDETQGLINATKEYIDNKLYNEFKVTVEWPGDEYKEPAEYEEIPYEVRNALVIVILRIFNIKFIDEDSIEICLSKEESVKTLEEFVKTLESRPELNRYHINIEEIYNKICKFTNSEEWNKYILKREEMFNQMNELKNLINQRVEKVLSY